MEECAPEADMLIGDARLRLQELPPASFDVLVIDAFSSDAIPLHLLTLEAMAIYERALTPDGLLLLHTSNRYVRLEPVVAQAGAKCGSFPRWSGRMSRSAETISTPPPGLRYHQTARRWTRFPTTADWRLLVAPEGPVWTDDYASVLPYLVWENFL